MPVNINNIIKNANWQEESQPAISDLVFLCSVLVYRSVCSDGCVSNFSSVVWMGSECLQLHYCEYTWIVTVGNHSKLMLTYKKTSCMFMAHTNPRYIFQGLFKGKCYFQGTVFDTIRDNELL